MAVSWDTLTPIDDEKQQQGSAVSWDALTPVEEQGYDAYARKNGEIYNTPKRNLLDEIGKTLNMVAQTPFKAYSQGAKNVEAAELNAKEIFKPLTPEEKKRMNQIETAQHPNYGVPDIKYIDKNITNLPERAANALKTGYAQTFENLPSSVEALKAGGAGSVVGGGVGLVGGALWGLKSGNPVGGALDGFKAGVRLGGGAGAARKSFELEAGFARQQLKEMKDKDGKPLPEDLVNNASIGVGVANAGLELVGLDAELKTFPGMDKVLKQAKKDFLKKVVEDETLRGQLINAGKQLVKSTATEMATEGIQQVSNIVAEEYSKNVAGNYDDALYEDGKINQGALRRHVGEIMQNAVGAIGPSLIIGGLGTAATATNILVKNGMDSVQAKKVADSMSVDERADLINNNLETLDKIAEDHITDVEAQDIEKNFFDKAIEAHKDAEGNISAEKESQVFSAAKLAGAFAKKFGSDKQQMQDWFNKLSFQNKPVEQLQGGVEMNVPFEDLKAEDIPEVYFQKAKEKMPSVEHYNAPEGDFNLPALSPVDLKLIGKEAKPVVLKKNIIEKNKQSHPEISTEEYNNILSNGLYNPDVILKTNPKKPHYYNFIYRDKVTNNQVLIELNENKDNFEVVNFYNLSDKSLARKVQAAKRVSAEGGQVLMTERNNSQGAAALSALDANSDNSLNDNGQNVNGVLYQEKGVDNTEDAWEELKSLADVHKDVRVNKKMKEQEYLGYFQEGRDKNIIGIMKDSNESTLVHEMGHLFLQGLNEFSQNDETSKQALAEVNDWLGYEGGDYSVAQQEKFAKGFEAYLYKGQAPTNTLREVFERFRDWLKDVYTHITQIADFSDEELNKIQSVFDNLFSEKSEKQKQIDSLVEKAKFVGLEKLSDTEARHKETAYDILSVALGKSKQWLKTILESESESAKILKQKEKIEMSLEHVEDQITGADGFLPEWSEFFQNPAQWSQESDYQLAQAAYNTIVDKTYKQDAEQYGFLDRTEQQYAYLINQYKNAADRDIPLAAFADWLATEVEVDFQDDYADRFNKDATYIERFENMDKFEQAKETILKAAHEAGPYMSSVEKYQEVVKAAMKSIKFLTPRDQAKLTANILDIPSIAFLEAQIDSILDIAKTMEDINYKKRLMSEIHKELQGTKNIKRSNKTVGKYDYTTNKVFERMREIEAMSVEQANEIRLEIGEHQEDNGLSFEDKIINAYINYKANGLTFTSTEAAKAMYDDIVKMKFAGNEAKSEQDFSAKLNLSNEIVEAVQVLDAMQKNSSWVQNKYLKSFVNWESALNALFNNKIMKKYSLLKPERDAKVYAWEVKKKFAKGVADIYGKSVENFDEPIVENINQKFEFFENVEDIENPGSTRKVPKAMNKMELILAYMWDKNEVLHERLLRQFGDLQEDGTYSDLELDRMFNELSDKDKRLGDLMMHTVNSIYPKANEAFIKKYGIDLPRVTNYFPSKVERISEVDLLTDFAMKSTDPSAIKRRSAGKNLKQDFGNPVLMMFQHIDSMSKFIHMTETLDKQNKIFKNKTLQKLIEAKYDKEVYQEFLRQLTANTYKQQAQNYNEDQKITDAVISNYLISNISFKPSIAIKQGITAMNYSEVMPALQWAKGFAKACKDAKGTMELMNKIPYLKARFETGGQNEFLENEITNSLFAKTGKIKDALTLNVRAGDIFAIAFGGRPYLEYLMKDQGMSEQDAIEEFLNHTQRTMQASETSTLSNYQIKSRNERGIASLVTAYRNAQAQYIRKSADAIISYSKGEMTKGQMAKTLFIYMYANAFMYRSATSLSAITLLTTGNGDDLRDDAVLSLFDFNADAHAIWGEIYQFIASVLYKKAVEAATGEKPDYMDFATKLPLVGDIQDQILKIAKEDVSFEDYFKFGGYLTAVGFGVPVNSVANSIGGLGDVIQGDFLKGGLKVLGYSDRRAADAVGEEE